MGIHESVERKIHWDLFQILWTPQFDGFVRDVLFRTTTMVTVISTPKDVPDAPVKTTNTGNQIEGAGNTKDNLRHRIPKFGKGYVRLRHQIPDYSSC